jgi:hypothetical protein
MSKPRCQRISKTEVHSFLMYQEVQMFLVGVFMVIHQTVLCNPQGSLAQLKDNVKHICTLNY